MITEVHTILNEINESNSTNFKLDVLKKYKNSEILQRVLKMTYDNVAYTYGVTVKNALKFKAPENNYPGLNLVNALDILENDISSRKFTGHDALKIVSDLIGSLNEVHADILKKIINRDLRINVGTTQINKVWSNLITKPVYMRCDVYGSKTSKNIKYPALVQLKADGTYRSFFVQDGSVSSTSRSGESYDYPIIFESMKDFPNGVYTGELTIAGYPDRAKANGLINSLNPPHESIILDLWDYITPEEYSSAGKKDKKNPCLTKYNERFNKLKEIIQGSSNTNIRVIDTHEVNSLKEALEITSKYMKDGYEGAVLKDKSGVFKDGTSKEQLKLKLKIDTEMRILSFQDGSIGTKREGKIGSIIFGNDEGTIKGRTSGFTDEQLDDMTMFPEKYINKIMTVEFNDLSKADGNDYYALCHPRFIEIRNDKTETDTLETVLKLRNMAMELE